MSRHFGEESDLSCKGVLVPLRWVLLFAVIIGYAYDAVRSFTLSGHVEFPPPGQTGELENGVRVSPLGSGNHEHPQGHSGFIQSEVCELKLHCQAQACPYAVRSLIWKPDDHGAPSCQSLLDFSYQGVPPLEVLIEPSLQKQFFAELSMTLELGGYLAPATDFSRR